MAKPSSFLPKKREGITLAETLIYISIFGVVSAGIWQTFIFINQSINTNINQVAELEESETYLNYISTLSAKAVSSEINGDKSCIFFENEATNGDVVGTRFKLVNDAIREDGTLFATGYVSTDPSANCDDTDLSPPVWTSLTDSGALSLVRSSQRSLDLGAIFNSDTDGLVFDYSPFPPSVKYEGMNARLGRKPYVGLSGAASFSMDFWIRDPFSKKYTSQAVPAGSDNITDNATIIAIGDPADPLMQLVLAFDERHLVLRRGAGTERFETNEAFDTDNLTTADSSSLAVTWHHVAVTWNDGAQEARFYVNGNIAPSQNPGPPFNFNLPIMSELWFGGFDSFAATTPDNRFQGEIDEFRIWDTVLDQQQIRDIMRRESLPEDAFLLNYWRFEEGNDNAALNDNATHIRDWDSTSAQHLRYYTTADNMTYSLAGFPVYLSRSAAPIAAAPFKTAGSNDALSLELQFLVTNSFGEQKRQPTLSKRVPVARFAPVGLVALEDNSTVEVEVEIIGSHEQFDLKFDAIFDPSVRPQANACDLYTTMSTPENCNFSASSIRVPLNSDCTVADNVSLATCTIRSRDVTLTDGVAFSSIELRQDLTSNARYQTVPGDKITMQIYETCTFGGDDDGATAMLIDTGYMQGEDFINRRSYVTYSFEAASGEGIEYLFGRTIGGTAPTANALTNNYDRVPGSPDFGAFTKRRHISPFLFRTTDDNYYFVMGFDRPHVHWSSGTDLWNDSFSSRYDFTVTSADQLEPCTAIGIRERDICTSVQDPGPVKICPSSSNTKYCYVEYKISNMPSDANAFVKLDEADEFQIPASSIEDLVGVNRWGNGYTDGFMVNLGVQNLKSYPAGDPLMQVLSRAGMDYWFLMTMPNDADGGSTVKLRLGETDTVRYRLSTSKVCP